MISKFLIALVGILVMTIVGMYISILGIEYKYDIVSEELLTAKATVINTSRQVKRERELCKQKMHIVEVKRESSIELKNTLITPPDDSEDTYEILASEKDKNETTDAFNRSYSNSGWMLY